MSDIVDAATRSRMMSNIKGKNTKPEKAIRSALHLAGFRFRLHRRDLPGKPDIVLSKHRAVIFVNGCFWHGHNCPLFKWPKTREAFWRDKITSNIERDRRNHKQLLQAGWRVCIFWECSIRGKPEEERQANIAYLFAWLTGQRAYTEVPATSIG